MANTFTYSELTNTNKRIVIKLTGELDASGEVANTKIVGSLIKGALANVANGMISVAMGGPVRSFYNYTIARVVYDVNIPAGYLKLSWDGVTPSTIATFNGYGDLNIMDNLGVITNNAGIPNGNVTITTVGAAVNNSYTLIIEIYKDPQFYDQGQIAKPQDFNIPGVTPGIYRRF